MRTRKFLMAVALSLVGSAVGRDVAAAGLPMVFNNVTNGHTAIDVRAAKIYGSRFRVVDVNEKQGFIAPKLLSGPPAIMHEDGKSNVLCLLIVTAEGQVIEPHVLKTNDQRISTAWVDSFRRRRYVAARFRGDPVACIVMIESLYGPDAPQRGESFKNGLGIQGYRDR